MIGAPHLTCLEIMRAVLGSRWEAGRREAGEEVIEGARESAGLMRDRGK